MQQFYSNGKLLLTGEYLILDGAIGLALPTVYGQDLNVNNSDTSFLTWKSFDENDKIWFSTKFRLSDLSIVSSNHEDQLSLTLQKILKEAQKLNPEFLAENYGFQVETKLTFNRNWGLGSSSTLINNIAQWAKINAFELLHKSFGGSGYDIACAQNSYPIVYQFIKKTPKIEVVDFDPIFKDQLYFVYLNKKQNSREGIDKYKRIKADNSNLIKEISQITNNMLKCNSLFEFEKLVFEHETIIGSIIKEKPIQQELFSDYLGQIKSLGTWGGDFFLATGNHNTLTYFRNKGFDTVIPYKNMIL
jgi:mevalonate kinase